MFHTLGSGDFPAKNTPRVQPTLPLAARRNEARARILFDSFERSAALLSTRVFHGAVWGRERRIVLASEYGYKDGSAFPQALQVPATFRTSRPVHHSQPVHGNRLRRIREIPKYHRQRRGGLGFRRAGLVALAQQDALSREWRKLECQYARNPFQTPIVFGRARDAKFLSMKWMDGNHDRSR